jgi:RNA polymerase sigma factor (sigma-70 family)
MDREADTDESLMLRYAGGDQAAFEALYRRHELPVWRFVYRTLRNQAIADELMQEVWFAVAREATRYRPTARFTTWLFTIAHNRMVDSLRTTRHHLSLDADDRDRDHDHEHTPLAGQLAADSRSSPLRAAEASEQAEALIAAVGQLPPEQRDAFLLQADAELSVEQIATVTGASFETTKSRLRYARARLRQLLWEHT